MIEVFGNRMEITNPGKPLIDVFRFIDHTPISRNEKLASLMRRMNKEDKRRAYYHHCCLQYLAGQKMSNESFRRRLGISNENYSMASRIISDTISAGYIKLDDRESVMLNHNYPLLEYKHTRLQGIIRKAKGTSGLQAYHSL